MPHQTVFGTTFVEIQLSHSPPIHTHTYACTHTQTQTDGQTDAHTQPCMSITRRHACMHACTRYYALPSTLRLLVGTHPQRGSHRSETRKGPGASANPRHAIGQAHSNSTASSGPSRLAAISVKKKTQQKKLQNFGSPPGGRQ
jgi:hypothetical protein